MSNEGDLLSQFPKSVKSVINYLIIEHVINGRAFVPFSDIVRGTGLSSKTVRKVLKYLKEKNLLKTVVDVTNSRRILYSLALNNIRGITSQYCSLSPGLYLIDIGVGLPQYLSLKTIRLLRYADYILYTCSVPQKILDLAYANIVERIDTPNIDLRTVVSSSGIRVILFDAILDVEITDKLEKVLDGCLRQVDVHFISNVSPIDIAYKMCRTGMRKKLRFRRDNGIEILITPCLKHENVQYSNIIKCITVRDGEGLVQDCCLENGCDECMYVIYLKY